MTRSLFRPEALDYQKQYREFGQVGRLQPLTLKILAWFLIAAVGALLVFICLTGYTRKETVSGYLAPAHGTAEVFVPQQGTVTSVHVAEDQLVAQGDLLLTIDTSQVTGDGLDVNAAVLKSLQLQKIVLTSQISAEERATRAEKDRLTAAISSGEAELAQIASPDRLPNRADRYRAEDGRHRGEDACTGLSVGAGILQKAAGAARCETGAEFTEAALRRAGNRA